MKNELISFANWLLTKNYIPLSRNGKKVWIDCDKHTYLVNGSDFHYEQLMKVGISSEKLIEEYELGC